MVNGGGIATQGDGTQHAVSPGWPAGQAVVLGRLALIVCLWPHPFTMGDTKAPCPVHIIGSILLGIDRCTFCDSRWGGGVEGRGRGL